MACRVFAGVEAFGRKVHKPRLGRADRGIYGGKSIGFGNQVSFSKRKTRRTWKPNVRTIPVYSKLLDRHMRIRMTMHAWKCVKKAGSIDNFLLYMPHKLTDSKLGRGLREEVLEKLREHGRLGEFGLNYDGSKQKWRPEDDPDLFPPFDIKAILTYDYIKEKPTPQA